MAARIPRSAHALLCTGLTLFFIAGPAAGQQSRPRFPEFADARLKQGRAVWLETCDPCHANDIAGAPLVSDKAAWKPRLAKGKDALYRSALNGLTGPKGTQMPPRGGNTKLADDDVRAAVDYMAAVVR